MKQYTCSVCGFSYDEESAQRDSTGDIITFEQLENDWTCPNCGVGVEFFNADPDEDNNSEFSL